MNYNSICSSCKHQSTCSFINHSKEPIIMCEEFELETAAVAKKEEKPSPRIEHYRSDKYTGLCVNCKNRETCKIRDDSFVKWHCEEYAVA